MVTRTAKLQLVASSAATVDAQVTVVVPTENLEPDAGVQTDLVTSRPPMVGSGNVTATRCPPLITRFTLAGHMSEVAGPATVTTGEGPVGDVSLQAATTLTSDARHNPDTLRDRILNTLKTSGQYSCYRWQKEYGGLRLDRAKRFKELERENPRLKKLVADEALDNAIPIEVALGNF